MYEDKQLHSIFQSVVMLLTISIILVACSSLGTSQPTPTPETTSWDYVALGDSFTGRGDWPKQYAIYIEKDLGIKVMMHNRAVSGQRIAETLDRLRSNDELRDLISEAEIITINWSPSSLNGPEASYLGGNCGGDDNQNCLRETLVEMQDDWEATLDQIIQLRGSNNSIIRTFLYGRWPYDAFYGGRVNAEQMEVLLRYYFAMNDFVAESAASRGIPVADVGRAFEGEDYSEKIPTEYLLSDGLHLSEQGSTVVADLLRELGYEDAPR
jgi:hypothetical protein